MQAKTKVIQFVRRQPRWKIALTCGVVVLAGWFIFSSKKQAGTGLTFEARRGTLQISVIEGGSIEALESQEIRSQVKGQQGTKILKIVEEGYQVTEDDVKTNKVLVELDSSDLQQRITQQEIQFQTTLASFTEATQSYEIQLNQNQTDINAAEQKAKFARMDLEKFMSDKATKEIIDHLKLYESDSPKKSEGVAQLESLWDVPDSRDSGGGDVAPRTRREGRSPQKTAETPVVQAPVSAVDVPVVEAPKPTPIDYSKYAKTDLLGDGAAKQQLRKLLDDLQVAEQQNNLSKTKFEGTKRLFDKGFVTKNELETEEMSYRNNELKIQTAITARDLFIKYEFPKQAEEFVSKYDEALRGLERVRKETVSKLAQARARFKGAEGRYNLEVAQTKELQDQLRKCIIVAEKTGLVVYGGGNQDSYYGRDEPIREGATVRERQPIITIPDMTQMSVKVKIHESYIKKVSRGIKTTIQVDAFPEETLTGEVIKVSVLPDSANRWMSPDLKVYATTVRIDGSREWVKPGMSAKVELRVKELPSVIHIPLQAVSPQNGKHFCHIVKGGKAEPREIVVGDFNDEFIEVKSGLQEGEIVLLDGPNLQKENGSDKQDDPEKSPVEKNAAPAKA